MRSSILAMALLVAACGGQQAVNRGPDVAAIEAQMQARFDRPGARLDAGPIAVSGDHAVADWTQGPMGGRALFERRGGEWALVLCSGDALSRVDYLEQARVPAAEADAIVRALRDAEQSVTAERLVKMRSFTGTVTAEEMSS